MTGLSLDGNRLESATSLEQIRQIVQRFSASAQGEGGVLYSGWIGNVRAEAIALEIAHKGGLPIVNDTPRARFLAGNNSSIIRDSAERIFLAQGESRAAARKLSLDFLYGDAKAPNASPTSIMNCLWCETSREFASSLRGNVVVVASAADANRVLGRVEVLTALRLDQLNTLGGQPLSHLRGLEAEGGIGAVLPVIERQFIEAANEGIFTLPDHPGTEITQVSVSSEVAKGLGINPERFVGGAYLQASGLIPAPIDLPSAAGLVQAAPSDVSAPTSMDQAVARDGGHSRFVRGAGMLAAATVAYDLVSSANSASAMLEQGNRTGAASEVVHFGTRNLGTWGGAVLGAEVFGTAGAETGPLDVVIGGAGALVGAIAGDKLADAMDRQRIYHQRDPDGRAWFFDPQHPARGWTHTASELDTGAMRLNDGFPVYREQSQTAGAALTDRLNYQASNAAIELALAHPHRPTDPYTQPASTGDTHSIRDAPWRRDPQTHVWTRRVVIGLLEHGMVNAHVERAPAARAAELDHAAERTVAENAAQSPRAIAKRYEAAYHAYGWQKYGVLPDVVATTLRGVETVPEQLAQSGRAPPLSRKDQPMSSPASVPEHLLDFRQIGHPLHAFYERALAKVHDMEDRDQMPYGMHSERLAAALTDAVATYNTGKDPRARFGTPERVELRGEGAERQAVAIDQRVNYHLPEVQVGIPVDKALARSVEQSSQDWARRHMPHLHEESPVAQARVAISRTGAWPAHDPRRPDDPAHVQFETLRGKVAAAYAQAGIVRSPHQLDDAAAAVLSQAPHGRAESSRMQISLLADPRTGVIGPDSDLLVQQSHGTLTLRTRIPSVELQASPDEGFVQRVQGAQHGQPEQAPQQAQVR
ncbi:XVIPCD domain-containing protein [Frateuria sp. GZRR35]|uniref:XVIPCD domain-containing protein n=1 Tax=Frateuria sp. GZRR35 TaxID=3351536 RepID=UPI003EDC9968